MKKVNKIFPIICTAVLLTACSDDNNNTNSVSGEETAGVQQNVPAESKVTPTQNLEQNFVVTGKVENGIHAEMVVETTTPRGVIVLGKSHADEDGNFKITGNIPALGLYQLRLNESNPNSQKVVPLSLVPEDSVNVVVNFDDFNSTPKYSGTEWAPVLNEYFEHLFGFLSFQRNLKDPQKYSQDELLKMIVKESKPMDDFCIDAITNDSDNPANIILVQQVYPKEYLGGFENWDPKNLDVLRTMQDGFMKSYPQNPLSQAIGQQVSQIENGYNEYLSFSKMKVAPEIAMPDPNGIERRLSDLRGKYVLIDFWASWCGPCRKENPNVVRLYNKYKDKGFDIFSVSLDKDAEAWKRAIKADNLSWENHVSELNYWNSSVIQTYKFQGIPFTVLVDKNGEIIAKGLRGQALENKLKELLD
ncbi:MAG: TlpA disulfide reductase family protein [Lishizhenia sp.]|nr:TlpA disulfide reductase family protein [Lishizhenia sp.]